MDLVQIQKKKLDGKKEPIFPSVEKGDHDEAPSPFDAPDAYAPIGDGQEVAYEAMHPFLQGLRDEHDAYILELKVFKAALNEIEKNPEDNDHDGFARFFAITNREVLVHNRREEVKLFPLLAQRLIESGEHSQGEKLITAVDMLEAEHLDFVQLMAVALNFFEISKRLPDPVSRDYVRKTAIQQGRAVAEQLRLHIFREDTVYFSLAHELISTEEFDEML